MDSDIAVRHSRGTVLNILHFTRHRINEAYIQMATASRSIQPDGFIQYIVDGNPLLEEIFTVEILHKLSIGTEAVFSFGQIVRELDVAMDMPLLIGFHPHQGYRFQKGVLQGRIDKAAFLSGCMTNPVHHMRTHPNGIPGHIHTSICMQIHFFGRANHTLHRGTFKEFLELQHLRLSQCAMAQENKQYKQILHIMVKMFHNIKDLNKARFSFEWLQDKHFFPNKQKK